MTTENKTLEQIADEIPADWCSTTELKDITKMILSDLKETMTTNIDEAAKLVNCAPEDIEEMLDKAADIYGRMMLFEEKFPEIINFFPKGEDDEINYPDIILAKIFNTTIEEAIDIFENHFGLNQENQISGSIIKNELNPKS